MNNAHTSALNHLTDDTFTRDIEASDGIALVKFTAEWCPPCKMLKPTLEALATEYAGRVAFHEIDNDANQGAAIRYGIRGLPTTLAFKNGKETARIVGLVPRERLRTVIDRLLDG